jgi:hypothetical protein
MATHGGLRTGRAFTKLVAQGLLVGGPSQSRGDPVNAPTSRRGALLAEVTHQP